MHVENALQTTRGDLAVIRAPNDREFFSDQLLDQVTGLYDVRPRIEFAEVVEFVDNS